MCVWWCLSAWAKLFSLRAHIEFVADMHWYRETPIYSHNWQNLLDGCGIRTQDHKLRQLSAAAGWLASAQPFGMLQIYITVIMGAMASQITSLAIVYSTVYSGADQRKHQSSASLAFVRGIHRSPNVSIWWRHHANLELSPGANAYTMSTPRTSTQIFMYYIVYIHIYVTYQFTLPHFTHLFSP